MLRKSLLALTAVVILAAGASTATAGWKPHPLPSFPHPKPVHINLPPAPKVHLPHPPSHPPAPPKLHGPFIMPGGNPNGGPSGNGGPDGNGGTQIGGMNGGAIRLPRLPRF